MIPITKPFIDKKEIRFFHDVIKSNILTDGKYQILTERIIKKKIGSKFVAITSSCTAALEITAILLNLKKGDEVIVPSYGFVSVANAIALRGAKPIFADINPDTLNICPKDAEKKINKNTVAIYIIHYAGNACEMDAFLKIKKKYKIFLIEDAAHALFSKFKNKYLGTLGDLGVFSFHETKNFTSGQGGCISVNNKKFINRVNCILDKGTNRKNFITNFNKKIIKASNKKFYSWVDLGSEYRAPELSCALLYSQLKKENIIFNLRKKIWKRYFKLFEKLKSNDFYCIKPSKYSVSSYHLLVIVFKKIKKSYEFKKFLQKKNIAATFHYVPLHLSKFAKKFQSRASCKLPMTENIYKKVVRLPLFPTLKKDEFNKIEKAILSFFKKKI